MICAYLTFNGNCREAMRFYQQCLGGKLLLQTVGESDMAHRLPEQMHGLILNATLSHKSRVMMGTDMAGPGPLIRGNNVSLLLDCGSETELLHYAQALSRQGSITATPAYNLAGTLLAGLTDGFGHHWTLYYKPAC